ncbi:hypothetical protein H0H92_003077 [Tricholoma furcatifolium]|nr:hypothetical protein H0H92_003077 [Tricholoma furcatifolium]
MRRVQKTETLLDVDVPGSALTAQRLSEQVKSLNSRVRELEAALARATGVSDDSVLRDRDKAPEEVDLISDAIGSLALGVDGQAKYHGQSAGSEQDESSAPIGSPLDLPYEIIVLKDAFPFGFRPCPYNKSIFNGCILQIPKERALELALMYYANVAWMYDPIPYDDFLVSIIDPIYGCGGYPNIDSVHSHRLAVFFMILANGTLYDESLLPLTAQNEASHYQALARAAMSMDSILTEVTCATVQALFLVFRFSYNSSQADKEERWLLTGLATRVAQVIGLQRDSAAWNLSPEEVQRRRRLFWELFVWENWSSLVHGRPGSLWIQHADCKYPDDLHRIGDGDDDDSMGFHAWKFRYSARCMSMTVEHVFNTRYHTTYQSLLLVDEVIRNFAIPKRLRWPEGDNGLQWSDDPALAMQQYCTLCVRDSHLLYIHRSYCAEALREASDDPLKHTYKKSVITAFQTSRRLVSVLKSLYPVVLASFVAEAPGCSLADKALKELSDAIPFFQVGSELCRPPSVMRACQSYAAFTNGQKPPASVSRSSPDGPDELEVVNGGRRPVVTTKSNPNSPSHTAASPSRLHQDTTTSPVPSHSSNVSDTSNYYGMEASTNMMPKQQEFQMDNMHRFEDQSTSSIGKVPYEPISRNHALPPITYLANHAIGNVPNDVHSGRTLHDQPVTVPQYDYAVPHSLDYAQNSPPNPHHSALYSPYMHTHESPAFQGGELNNSYAYSSRLPHAPPIQQNQEMWGGFVMGYGH